MADPQRTRETSHVHVANQLLGWTIMPDGGARLNQQAVDKIDRMVCTLMRIRDGAVTGYCPTEIARMAKDVLQP